MSRSDLPFALLLILYFLPATIASFRPIPTPEPPPVKAVFHLSPLVSVEAEGNSHKDLFQELAGLAEVFSIDTCGVCKGHSIIPIVRDVEGVKFYEYKCQECHARLSLGQSKVGGALYPRRTRHKEHPEVRSKQAEVGSYLPNGGWSKWTQPEQS